MKAKVIAFVVLMTFSSTFETDSCPATQYIQFLQKEADGSFPIISNPYLHPSQEYLARVEQNMGNRNRVCALRYLDSEKKHYILDSFESRSAADSAGWIVTHQGVCGKCSSLWDLYVYLTRDLTRPVRRCGTTHFMSDKQLKQCIKMLGFTDACTQVWFWNVKNTKHHCGTVCAVSDLKNQPFVINGQLNKCLQCDEDISGPIFKYESGRTRRNSGIKSEIDRPVDQIYNLTHCYY